MTLHHRHHRHHHHHSHSRLALRLAVLAGAVLFTLGAGNDASADEPNSALRASLSPVHLNDDGSVTVDDTTFPDLAAYHGSEKFKTEGRRCATDLPQMSFLAPSDCSLFSTSILSEYDPGAVFEIPVVFHVVMDSNGNGDVADNLLRSQVDILNEDFRALSGTPGGPGNDATVQFALARVDPLGAPTTGINRYNNNQWYNDANSMKPTLNWDTTRYLNLYTNTASGALGYATFPVESAGDPDDGVVLCWQYVGRNAPLGDVYNQGRTATHEVGHYLGLFHTFQGGCGSAAQPYTSGDLIADTVQENQPQFDCSEQQSACGGGFNPIHNYMDYTNDTCMDHFTPEQVNRMRCSIMNYRPQLINLVPGADFTYDHGGSEVRFINTSYDDDGTVVAAAWDFGDGMSSTELSPTHTFQNTGAHQVSLTVTDDRGSQATVTRTLYASDKPIASFSKDNDGLEWRFTDTSQDVNGPIVSWAWDFGDSTTSTEQNPAHTYLTPGKYTVTMTIQFADNGSAQSVREFDVDEGGCGCVVGHAPDNHGGPWLAGLFLGLLGVLALRRRKA